jgi:hypothetical protein
VIPAMLPAISMNDEISANDYDFDDDAFAK